KALDDAAGGVAVQGGQRAAQDLDALQAIEVEQCRLALAVGHGQGDTVLHQAHPAHAELRAGTEAARGYLQVLGVVLAAQRHQPGDPLQGFGEVGAQVGGVQLFRGHGMPGQRQLQVLAIIAAAEDDLCRQAETVSGVDLLQRGNHQGNRQGRQPEQGCQGGYGMTGSCPHGRVLLLLAIMLLGTLPMRPVKQRGVSLPMVLWAYLSPSLVVGPVAVSFASALHKKRPRRASRYAISNLQAYRWSGPARPPHPLTVRRNPSDSRRS